MLGATLFLVGIEMENGEFVENANSCTMCKRMIINSGIAKVIIRKTQNNYEFIDVHEWIDNDDSLSGEMSY